MGCLLMVSLLRGEQQQTTTTAIGSMKLWCKAGILLMRESPWTPKCLSPCSAVRDRHLGVDGGPAAVAEDDDVDGIVGREQRAGAVCVAAVVARTEHRQRCCVFSNVDSVLRYSANERRDVREDGWLPVCDERGWRWAGKETHFRRLMRTENVCASSQLVEAFDGVLPEDDRLSAALISAKDRFI